MTASDGGVGPMRAKMVATLAEFLDISYEKASAALHEVWEHTKDVDSGENVPSWQPDLSNPGHALAHRVQQAITREFDGEEMFEACVVVRARTGHIGMAATMITFEEVEWLLRMGIGSARRTVRQHGGEP